MRSKTKLNIYSILTAGLCVGMVGGVSGLYAQAVTGGSHSARPQLAAKSIDAGVLAPLAGHVRPGLTAANNAGLVEDSTPIGLTLVLQRSKHQQEELDALIANQQNPDSTEYHKWLTPAQYGERFGTAESDVQQVTLWLQSQGIQVKSVLNNASMITIQTTAGGVRNTFHTQLHYWNIEGGKYIANAQDPQIPAALTAVVGSIKGLSAVPPRSLHTPIHPIAYNETTHKWQNVSPGDSSGVKPDYVSESGAYVETPQDLYTIYNVNPVHAKGNRGAGATIGIPEPTDMNYGTVDANGNASGGDVTTFRNLFGITTPLSLKVMHGAGTVSCAAPGVRAGFEEEAALDVEWAGALAPEAQLLLMSCDVASIGDGLSAAELALVDNNLSDVISVSYGGSESGLPQSEYLFEDDLYSQAASQGQTFIVAGGDSGSDTADIGTSGIAVDGLNVSFLAASPLVTAVGGTDFADKYDADLGGPRQSTYWSAKNSQYFGNALGYIPETVWNDSCASSIIAKDFGNFTDTGLCGIGDNAPPHAPQVYGSITGGGGGFSKHYAQPSYQAGIPGLSKSATMRAYPDVSLFAASGFWGHFLVICDLANPCTSTATVGGGGGTSFSSPQVAGITALLITQIGGRVGGLNTKLYSLAKTQYRAPATATACYSNGHTANTGVTRSLPAANCIFNDVTTSNNDVPCAPGSLDCFVNQGAQYGIPYSYGMLSLNGAKSLVVGYAAGPQYDEATGLGTLNVANLVAAWNQTTTQPADMVSPASGSTLTGSSATFTWSAGIGVAATQILVGRVPGHHEYGGLAPNTGSSYTVTNLPTDGRTLYVTLQSRINSQWVKKSYTYTAYTAIPDPAAASAILSPAPSSILIGSRVTFHWSAGIGVAATQILVGKVPGHHEYGGLAPNTGRSYTVTNLPTDGRTLYVTLQSRMNNQWVTKSYTYTAYTAIPDPAAASVILSPVPSSVLTGSTATFTWSAGTGVAATQILIGKAPGHHEYGGLASNTGSSYTVTNLPTDGRTLYVTLQSRMNNQWVTKSYTYTAIAATTITTLPTASALMYGQTLSASTLTGGVASTAGSFTFTTPTLVPAVGTASYAVTFTPTDTTNPSIATGMVSVTVNMTMPTITNLPTASTITYGQMLSSSSLQGGVASIAGSFAWTSQSFIPLAGVGSFSVTFTPTDSTHYSPVTNLVSVSVDKATPTVTTSPMATGIVYPQTLSFSILQGGVASVAGTFTWVAPTYMPVTSPVSELVMFTPTDQANYAIVDLPIILTVSFSAGGGGGICGQTISLKPNAVSCP